ncbi:MAG: type II toxin-antitoxin system RelE/ParE family toxin [Gammaproteobacteria bacterium]|nr:type II toxin-antitoxin system RelE/ParE family toxin [Gammaproteobacteria bacterium]
MKIIWLPWAIQDQSHFREYIAQENLKAAKMVANKILKTTQLLSEQPYLGVATDIEDVYEKQVVDLPYLIPYRVINNQLQMLRVFHEAQQKPKNWA